MLFSEIENKLTGEDRIKIKCVVKQRTLLHKRCYSVTNIITADLESPAYDHQVGTNTDQILLANADQSGDNLTRYHFSLSKRLAKQ